MTEETKQEKESPHRPLDGMTGMQVEDLAKYATLPNMTDSKGPNLVDIQAGDHMTAGRFFQDIMTIAQDTKLLDTALRSSPSFDPGARPAVTRDVEAPKAKA